MALTKIRGDAQILDESIRNAQLAVDAAIETTKLADGAEFVQRDGSVAFTAPISGVTPTQASHLATKQYVDNASQGLDVKDSVRAISVANITLDGLQQVDGVDLEVGDRVLVAGQTLPAANGIYDVVAGLWVRSSDSDTELSAGTFVFVEEGDDYAGTGWVLITPNPIVVGTTPLNWVQFSQAGVIQVRNGLTRTGNVVDVVSGNAAIASTPGQIALVVSPDGTLAIDATGVKLASLPSANFLIGNASGVATPQVITGDVTFSATGVATISPAAVGNAEVAGGSLNLDRLVTGTAGQLVVTDAAGVPTYTTITGDVTIDEDGVATLAGTVLRASDFVTRETPSGAINGANTSFSLAQAVQTGSEHVYFNGLLLDSGAGNDYTIAGQIITTLFTPVSGDKLRVSYIAQQ